MKLLAALWALLVLPTRCVPGSFRFAVVFSGQSFSDYGPTYYTTLARIKLQKYLTATYPNMTTDHVFNMIPSSSMGNCDPRILTWLTGGVDVIFADGAQQPCLVTLASSWPNVTFAVLSGFLSGPPNYVNLNTRYYEVIYLAGYTAGLMTKTKKVCVSAIFRIPVMVVATTAFCRGTHDADPSVQIHLMDTLGADVVMDIWIVNQSHALGCDVVVVPSYTIDGIQQASNLGMMSIGSFSDARLMVGESVLVSTYIDPTPMFIRTAEAVLRGTLADEARKADWFMGWEWGTMVLTDFSFLVPPNVSAKVLAQIPNVGRVWCGLVCTTAGCLCNSSSCCLSDAQLDTLLDYPPYVTDHGAVQLPGRACVVGQAATWHLDTFTMVCSDCPAGTYAYNADQVSECRPCPISTYSLAGAIQCTACPAGTHNNQAGQGQCRRCPAGAIAANAGAAECNACASGVSLPDGTVCAAPSLAWLAGVGGGAALLGLLFGGWAWWVSRRTRALRKQFSNDRVAVECAAAIARLDLQAVTWLSDIPNPNRIQLSFLRIVKILGQVCKYVPDQLLQSLANDDSLGEGSDAGEEAVLPEPPAVRSSIPPSPHSLATTPKNLVLGRHGRQPSSSSQGAALLGVRRVAYLLAAFRLGQHNGPAAEVDANLKAFLRHLVEVVRAHGGTLGAVSFDRAVVHWGAGRRPAPDAPALAVETALALTGFSGTLFGGAELQLNIAIGYGSSVTGVVETPTSSFFVVCGGQVPVVEGILAHGCRSGLGVQVLITDAVRLSVQGSHLCHPRPVEGEEVLWEPVARRPEGGPDEWMYHHEEGETAAAVSPADRTS